ncbi:ATP-binding protein [Cryobacterium sp. MDB1-18-2]|uniref:sensor histidine kinase n=1 Tax=unclassified Cryobacterium TaxID=2649013 RepID=UPI00106B3204|nr:MULTISPECIES: ATP-binding protein [unclassified Cryobacterium]MEB0002652.1 ATP-binding protein [Cryobacterium sp. RTC2.1]MEB0287016.1 ATP-binding protein [Cryobacterium sp. 10S3]TFC35945.1 ATP-binding protein [Cryobacterium sp. MDB1-18-2]TFC41565.1 ATP-binding protein [Cryobacterium sp. MDB1-18-1]WPX12911.1 ATP-binding protein [Cryobacterium sp. 10S3]
MTLGLPDHLVGTSVGRALAQATHWFGLTCLVGALVSIAVLGISHPSAQIGVSLIGILSMAILLFLLSRHRTVLLSVAYLLVGSVVTYVVSVTLLGLPELFHSSDVFLVSMPKMALLMVGGVGTGALVGVLWGTAGFILAETVTVLAALETGVPYHPDAFTVSTYLFLVGVMLVSGLGRRRHRPVQLAMHRALQEDQSRLLRHELDVRAVALSQDTTLNQLVALVHAHPGPLGPHLAAGIRETVDTLHGTSWLTDSDERLSGPDGWLDSAVYSAIERCRDRGLVVEVTGERAALGRLDAVADRELGLAVQQCLINVILHAGIVSAEVVIESTDRDLSVMVMDAGRGFTESETGADRLGLRQAVRRRIERLGGSVTIMTRPGAGTSVLLTVPAPPGDAVERPGTGAASGPASDPAGDTASDAGIGWPL